MSSAENKLEVQAEWVHIKFAEKTAFKEVYGFAGNQGVVNLEGIRFLPKDRPSRTLLIYMHPSSTLQLLPMPRAMAERGIHVLCAGSRYARNDTSVTAQVLKLTGTSPDAILIAGSGTPAALPQIALKERGYAGKVYQTHGVANADFLRVGGKSLEGTFLPAGPVLVADQLPANHPIKKSASAYVAAYEAAYGKGSVSTFGAHAWDAGLLMQAAVPVALTINMLLLAPIVS